ncbi:MAG: hypothetical protein OIN86_14125 [Candidatus Methanoperedens sp.]|nr:hypothetical protein [Candidatus Methanoperedens sp.]
MIDKNTVYEELKSNLKNIRFNRLCNAAEYLVSDSGEEKEAM